MASKGLPESFDSRPGPAPLSSDASSSLSAQTQAGTHDGSGSAPASEGLTLPPGSSVGRYLILGKLGTGSMGVVYTAHDPELDRTVALKLLRPRPELDKIESGHRKLLAEAQALARISHPNVVSVFDVGAHLGLVFVAMELVDGETLTEWLGQPRQWPEILDAVTQSGRGLLAVHAADLVHRDVKLDNVMIGRDGRVRLMDFGLARAATARRLGDGSGDAHATANLPIGGFVGTPAYSAPEQLLGRRASASADQFSFCVMLWEALHGQRPFVSDSIPGLISRVLEGSFTQPRPGARVPGWLRRVVMRGLAYDAAQRWPSIEALLEALNRGRSRAKWRRGALTVGAVGIAAVAAAAWQHYDLRRRTHACSDAGAGIAQVWNEQRAANVRDAIVGTGVTDAEATAQKVIPWLDEHAEAWRLARTDACMRTDVELSWDADTLDRSLWCLDERRIEFESLLSAFERGDASSVANAVEAATLLGRLEPCTDASTLSRRPRPEAQTRDAVIAVRDELLRAGALQQLGAYDDGLALAQSVLEHAEDLAWLPLVAEARLHVGQLYERRGDYPQAEQALEAAYFEAGLADADDVAASAARGLVGVVGGRLGRHADALRWARHHELVLSRTPDPTGLNRASHAEGLAIVHEAMGDLAEAKRLFEQAIAVREKVLGPDHPTLVELRGDVAALLHDLGDYAAAKALNLSVLAAREQALGPSHPAVGNSLHNLARDCRALGEVAEAKALYERALAIWEVSLGPEHPHVAQLLNNLSNMSVAAGDLPTAMSLSERALAIRKRALGPDHTQVAQSLSNLATLHELTGDPRGAKELYEQAVAIDERALGPDHPDLAAATTSMQADRSSWPQHSAGGDERCPQR